MEGQVWVQHSDFSLEPPPPPPKLPGHFEAVSEADGHGLESCQGRPWDLLIPDTNTRTVASGQDCVDLNPIENYNFGWGPNFVESPSSLVLPVQMELFRKMPHQNVGLHKFFLTQVNTE